MMKTNVPRLFALALGLSALVVPAASRAQQVDTNPPLPNVLLLLDNSGSMERMIDGSLPEDNPQNACNCDPNPNGSGCNFSQSPQPNRWNIVQQALTGTLQNGFNCVAMPRTPNSTFVSEYQIAGNTPYDTNYYLAFHRMVAQDNSAGGGAGGSVACVVAPYQLPGAITPGGVGPSGLGSGGLATDFAKSITTRPYGQLTAAPNSCVFSQLANGALATMTDLMRFGLMTFDQDPSAGTGVNAPALTVANPPFDGMWSYFPGWSNGSACTEFGLPVNCAGAPTLMAVGARNAAAPPWEGRMVGFPTTNDVKTGQEVTNAQISSVVLASRPYGATPMAGMLTGAQYYFRGDPTGPQQTDPYAQGGCRPEYIVVLTDGAPNLDMRPACEGTGSPNGVCPFQKPEDIAAALYNNGVRLGSQQFVTTYVVGFAVSSFQDAGTLVRCSDLVNNGQLAAACDPNQTQTLPPQYSACCELQKIALQGGSKQAYFADTPGDLQKALGSILADIAKQATTRTTPVFSPVLTSAVADPNAPQTNASSFLASFNPSPGAAWSGDVQRQRYDCTFAANAFTVQGPPITASLGDDFAANLNSGAGPARTFIALEPDGWNGTTVADSTQTIRPFVTTSVGDHLGRYGATAYAGRAADVIAQITPDALGIPTAGCPYTPTTGSALKEFLTPTQCRDMLLDVTFGQPFSGPSDFTFASRQNNAFGDVFHASPIVVDAPASLLQDPSYTGFRAAWNAVPASSGRGSANPSSGGGSSTTKPRDPIVYVATNDGLLHAFWTDENKLENNEEWALIPPAVMPNLLASYPSTHEFLLDGSPVVKDVVWDRSSVNDPSVWHTMLVAGFGPSQQGYYAVDITNPDASGLLGAGSSLTPPGPQFRWQLTKMPATNYPVFGQRSAIPAITTLFLDPDGNGAREIGVAILPGGVDNQGPTSSASSGPSCQRAPKLTDSAPSGYPARSAVRCWNDNQTWTDPVNGRSLAVVRIDTGEILRVFARLSDVTSHYPSDTLNAAGRIIDTPLDSPMTGTPVVYPSDVGTAATKVFVGDADGTIWRFDVSNADPSKWSGELFLDTYNTTVDTNQLTGWADGQPFDVPTVASLDSAGEVVLNAATGSIENFDNTGTQYVYSITERVQGTGAQAKLRASVNWWFGPTSTGSVAFRSGERVSGPMTVFNGTLYFSSYWAGDPAAMSCTSGSSRLWGFDFVRPNDTKCTDPMASCDRSQGGIRELPGAPDYIDPTTTGASPGAVIPGVAIRATPACASLQAGTDSYVAGATHSTPQNFTAGSYSLFAQVGAKGGATSNGVATQQVDVQLQTPTTPTVIDSWAAVLE